MLTLKKYALLRILNKTLAKQCGPTIARSGRAGEATNCYSTQCLTVAGKRHLLQSLAGEEVSTLEHDGASFSLPTVIPLDDVLSAKLTIHHYVGLASITYSGVFDATRGMVLRWPYLVVWTQKVWAQLAQALFNRRSLASSRRFEILAQVIDIAEEGKGDVGPTAVMSKRYGSDRWAAHPDYWALLARTEFHLKLLVDSGELEARPGGKYWPTGLGMRVREESEEQERRHRENVRVQIGLGILALFAGVMAAAQANLIRLPTVLDLAPVAQSAQGPR